jgi:hypothetical protein
VEDFPLLMQSLNFSRNKVSIEKKKTGITPSWAKEEVIIGGTKRPKRYRHVTTIISLIVRSNLEGFLT